MLRLKNVLVATTACCVASWAAAQDKPSFESLDKNSDGQISIQEATSNDDLFVAFKELDTDRDGALSKEEYARYKPSR